MNTLHKASLLFAYKGYFPSNQLWWWTFRVYGDHVPTSFVPSTIYWVPAMLLNGVMPHGYNRCRLQLLFFCLIVTDLHSPVVVLIYSVDAIPLRLTVGLLQMQSISDSIVYGVLLQNPVQSPIPSISCSTEFWIVCYLYTFASYAAIGACADTGCLISFISFSGS